MTKLLRMIWLRHLPISQEQSAIQALSFEAIKWLISHYSQIDEFEH